MATITERKAADGQRSYRVQVRLKGHPVQSASFERRADAKRWAAQTESAIREGRYFKTTEAKRHTLADAIDRYCRDVLPTKGRQRLNQSVQLQWWKDELGAYTLADITPARIAEYRDRLLIGTTRYKRSRSPATVNRYLAAISHLFTITVNEWGWLDDNPIRKVRRPKESRGRVRFLADDERIRLLEACKRSNNPHLYAVVVMALSTGARKNEIMSLTWKDIDLKRGLITLNETKNGERRGLPLASHALELVNKLASVRRIDTNLLFPRLIPQTTGAKQDGDRQTNEQAKLPADIRNAFVNAVKAAGIEDFRFHDLRHSAASYLAMNGASLAEIAEVLGHKTLQMVKRYAHLSHAHTASVVQSMNDKIFAGA